MRKFVCCLIVVSGFLTLFLPSASAQEFRIYTNIKDLTKKDEPVVSRTLTIFHAGKVYDSIGAIGEVIIFEPMQKRFTILNVDRKIMTTVPFNEIKKRIEAARQETQKRLAQLKQAGGKNKLVGFLSFQLQPVFKTAFNGKTKRLTLLNAHLQYDVKITNAAKAKTAVKAYVKYVDWMSRLNYVLHPRHVLPNARLELNKQLAQQQVMPTEVVLRIRLKEPMHLRAEHKIGWVLQKQDRTQLNLWEALLSDKDTQRMTFHEYQKIVLQTSN